MSNHLMRGVTFSANHVIDVLIVCESEMEQRHLKTLFPYAFVVKKGYTLAGMRFSTIWVSPQIDKLSQWYQQDVLTRIVPGGNITTMDASEY